MLSLFIILFMSFFILYLASFGLVLKVHYDRALISYGRVLKSFKEVQQERTMKLPWERELWKQRMVYLGFLTSNGTGDINANLQSLLLGDADVERDNCMQGIAQICVTLSLECDTDDPLDVWGWAVAAVNPNYSVLDSNDYEYVSGSILRLKGRGYVDLMNVPTGSLVNGCQRDQLISRGMYYYDRIIRVLGCDKYGLDLNRIKKDEAHPCYYSDTLRYK